MYIMDNESNNCAGLCIYGKFIGLNKQHWVGSKDSFVLHVWIRHLLSQFLRFVLDLETA